MSIEESSGIFSGKYNHSRLNLSSVGFSRNCLKQNSDFDTAFLCSGPVCLLFKLVLGRFLLSLF
jgi:hypothetical protein